MVPGEAGAQVIVRLKRLRDNYRVAVARAEPAKVAPVVKADAYGLGIEPVARAFASAGADTFFVARLQEGIALRLILPAARIFVLDGVAPGTAPALFAHHLLPVLNAPEEIAAWSELAATRRTPLGAALHVDVGMNRSGLSPHAVDEIASRAGAALKGIDLQLVMSHLACADEPNHAGNRKQLERFRAALAKLPPGPASLAASAGIELGRDFLFDLVRPGIALYGGNPVPSRANPYRGAARLTAPVLQIRHIPVGESVGYGATFTTRRPTVLATVAAGYADGMIRACGAKGHAAIGGIRVPLAGRISMDLLSLDVTDIAEAQRVRGAEVELMGDTVSLEEVADAAGTIGYEVLTGIRPRVRRVYVDE